MRNRLQAKARQQQGSRGPHAGAKHLPDALRRLFTTLAITAALVCTWSGIANAKSAWTVIVVLGAEYADLRENLQETGSSDDVNVVVLHSDESVRADAYRVLKDTNASHPKGQCCPGGVKPCCGVENIPLSAFQMNSPRINKENVGKFFKYAQENYPAEHYLISFRGHTTDESILNSDQGGGQGITMAELGDVLRDFTTQHGKKIDVLNIGLCWGGNVDFAYAVSPYVQYYVGTPQRSSVPIAMRWRIYRWSREVIENPAITARTLAGKIVDIFTQTTEYCVNAGHGCSLASREGIFWTSTAVTASKMPTFINAMKDMACTLSETGFPRDAAQAAVNESAKYNPRTDLKHYLMNVRKRLTNPAQQAAVDAAMTAYSDMILKWAFEPGGYGGNAYGLSTFTPPRLPDPTKIGTYQSASMWHAYIAGMTGQNFPKTTIGLAVDTPKLDLKVGSKREIVARGVTEWYGPSCRAQGVQWTVDNPAIVKIVSAATNPVAIEAVGPGTATVRATANGKSADVLVTVATPAPADAGAGQPTDEAGVPLDPGTDDIVDEESLDPSGTGTGLNPDGTGASPLPPQLPGTSKAEISTTGRNRRGLAPGEEDSWNCTASSRPTNHAALASLALMGLAMVARRWRKRN